MPASAQTILFLAANPTNMDRLQLGTEVRDIEEGLRRSQHRDAFEFEQRWAVRPRDVQRAMLDVNPQIVHFSGNGKADTGLVFEDLVGKAKSVEGAALANLFALFAQQVRCVVLNGCYSEKQAKAIAQHIPYVIGMNGSVKDETKNAFSVGFYDGLGAGRNIDFAYQLGCSAIQMEGLAGHLTPTLLRRSAEQTAQTAQPNQHNPQPMPPADATPEPTEPHKEPLEVFVSYSRDDEELKDKLCKQLSSLKRQKKITLWQDREIEAGEEWNEEIEARLESADIFLLLISASFIDSDFCYSKEMARAMERHENKSARVIPVIMKPCDWKETPFSKLQALPKDAQAVTSWADKDAALYDTAKGIRRVVESFSKKPGKK